MTNKFLKTTILGIFLAIQSILFAVQAAPNCDQQSFLSVEAQFRQAQQLKERGQISEDDYKRLAADYIHQSTVCYDEMVSVSKQADIKIDEGGVWMPGFGGNTFSIPMPEERLYRGPDHSKFVLDGRKWGSPVMGTPGGTVTYSLMANGVSMLGDPDFAGANSHISALTGYSACFLTEINTAFAAWSAVSNIDFIEVIDNGLGFNVAGAAGHIRIGAHPFDGPSGTLAHGFFPPPNGLTAAGDIHFDTAETWSCTAGPGVFDFGIVVMHEIGHAIGLRHEETVLPGTTQVQTLALMNPFYNAGINGLYRDDIEGVQEIYGASLSGSGSMVYTPIAPCRVLDSRKYSLFLAGETRNVTVIEGHPDLLGPIYLQGGDCHVNSLGTITAIVANITSTQAIQNGHITVWANGNIPNASVVNYSKGEDIANSVIIPVYARNFSTTPFPPFESDYLLSIRSSQNTHLIIDVMGYFSYPSN